MKVLAKLCAGVLVLAAAPAAMAAHAVAMYGSPKYPSGFEHFDYVNPDAPKGGTLRLANTVAATFDSLNPFILKGNPAADLTRTYDTLTVRSLDEPFTEYGLVAKDIEIAPDRTWVRYRLRKAARFHDGEPITAEDVAFSFRILKEKGHPQYRSYYKDVTGVDVEDAHTVTFHFASGDNRELPLILGQLPILPKHYWAERDFDKTTLDPPLGSGPYRIAEVDPGKRIVYERVDDYWAKDLPVNRGRYNFERISYDYYRDATVAVEALKGGAYDMRIENVAKNWATAYNIPALEEGRLVKQSIDHNLPFGVQGWFFNTRRPVFQDPRVREAIGYAFDFQWTNRNLFYGAYKRLDSYFANSELAARGKPSGAELKLLEPWRDQLPERVFSKAYTPPSTAGEGGLRDNLRRAVALLNDAGYAIRDGRMVNEDTGKPLSFEILLDSASMERVTLPFVKNLERLGIDASVRTVDPTQYQNRVQRFEYDMIAERIAQSLSPGNEQRAYWGCEAAKTPGSQNYAGICSPAIDALIDKVIHAPDREALVTRTRALDRALLWGFYVVPHWYSGSFRLVYWDKFGQPARNPPYGLALDSWWVNPEKAAALSQ
ncbi:extracellular solute-binding protein [Arhodomonas aquaeolei]|uniref:extracellular solute-binding protein n=1 Tax=Arhodomonas aquaeolei TaxID=2369 RepID=UPI0021699EA3|nr:extracellular solute-binding protein [Arhodomonas aquaeolei]MCS4503923.1 extracellular solute-binding protein [Arhodomonas aquaeolei]